MINTARKLNLRPFVSGLVLLFILAHFGHHGVGAMLNPLMPMIRSDLGLNLTQSGLLMSAFTITNGFAQLPAGWLADRLGARFMVLLSITGVALAGFFLGFSNSLTSLAVFLVLAAIMGGGYHPASAAAISSAAPAEYRGRALGIHLIGGTSAFWMLPLIIAPIAATWGWRMPFRTVLIPIAFIGILVYILMGRLSLPTSSKRRSEGSGASAAPAETVNWGRLVPFMALSVLAGAMIMSTQAFISFYAVDELNVPETTIPLLMAVGPAMGLFMAPLGGYLSDRFGGMRVMITLGFAAIPLIYLTRVVPNVPSLIALMVAYGLVTNTRMPTSESYIAGNTPERLRSTMLGIYFFVGTGVAGPLSPFIGNLIDKQGYQQTFALSAAVTAVITVLCALFLWRAKSSKPKGV
ncbi:MAG: MFS transporter [Chloroflexi bacterium]|nr:MFS transporter [Chloroflexota bacterium]